MELSVQVKAVEGTEPDAMDILLAATEHCCVVMQTLRGGVDIDVLVNKQAEGVSQ